MLGVRRDAQLGRGRAVSLRRRKVPVGRSPRVPRGNRSQTTCARRTVLLPRLPDASQEEVRWVLRGGVGGTCSQTLAQLTAPFSADADDPEFNATKPNKAKTEDGVERKKDDEQPDWEDVLKKMNDSADPATIFHTLLQKVAVPDKGEACLTLSVHASLTYREVCVGMKPQRCGLV